MALETLFAALHRKYGKNTLTKVMIRACSELDYKLNDLGTDYAAISMVEQHLNMNWANFRFNPEKYSNHTIDFNPKLVREIED